MRSLIGLRAFDERTYDLISADDKSPVNPFGKTDEISHRS
jgi:hypothetical protein